MAAASGAWITLASEGSRVFRGYLAQPDAGRGPGLVILHDMFGPNRVFQALADEHAARGRAAIVPNLFWRSDPDGVLPYEGPHEGAWARLRSFDLDAAMAGLRDTVQFLRRAPSANGKVAALGFCFSGNLAFLAASGAGVDAAISFYALGISGHLTASGPIACPVQLHYGLADHAVPLDEIDAVAKAVAGQDMIELYRYPGAGHSFFNPVRPMYDAAASALAAERVETLLARLA